MADDPKVKELIAGDAPLSDVVDAATRAELERWFGLPSFQELADKGEVLPEDPELEAKRKLRAQAIAAVDPALVEEHRRRVESGEGLLRFQAVIELRIDPSIARIDLDRIEQRAIAEPREVELSDELRDDLAQCAPQAILRDLHRPELFFDKAFEIVDMAAEQRLDIVAAVAEAMRTRWTLTLPPSLPAAETRVLLAELRAERLRSIAHLLPLIPNRRVTE